ncbi:MAG: hypothetical protein QXZ35_02195 [Candidatus Micrarchaeaceae archaeon]
MFVADGTGTAENEQHAAEVAPVAGRHLGEGTAKFLDTRIFFAAAIITIIILTIAFRISLLKDAGFYEPDGFYHYRVILTAIANNFVIPQYLNTSGWPAHTLITEPHGLYWVTLVPYFFLRYFGISAYTVMRLVPVFFGILDVFGAYYLSRFLSKDKLFGLLVMLFVALSLGDAARTSALIYRGDGFVTIFLLIALVFMIKIFEEKDRNRKIAYAVISAVALSLTNVVWNGAPFATAVYVFAFALIVLYSFIMEKKEMLRESAYPLAALLVWYLLANSYKALHVFISQTFTGKFFVLLYAAMLIGWGAAYLLSERAERFKALVGTAKRRIYVAAAFLIISIIAIDVAAPAFVYQIFVGNGFITTSSFAATIEELQAPTPSFLFSSFGPTIFTTPMSIVLYLSTFVAHPKYAFWILMLVSFLPYFFMQIEGSGNFSDGKAQKRFHASAALLVLLAYYAITGYLQMHAVRFNSLVAVPLAIFSAYTFYWLIKHFHRYRFIGYGILTGFIVYIFVVAVLYSSAITQADGINPAFLQALSWLKNNTAPNSVVLTLWPDGSVVEGWANRTSVMDSVGSQNVSKADPFAAWLLNSSDDPQFLLSNMMGRPDYLLTRYFWLEETGGIYTEAGISENSSQFAYLLFNSFSISANSTALVLTMSNTVSNTVARAIITTHNGTQTISAFYIGGNSVSGYRISPFANIEFYNQLNASSVVVPQKAFNRTNGQTLLISYSPIPNPKIAINVTGAMAFMPGLFESNMAKFLYQCGASGCAWNNSIAGLKLVYINSDTKIFRIVYNNTA